MEKLITPPSNPPTPSDADCEVLLPVMIDPEGFTEKPRGQDTGKISKRIETCSQLVSLDEFIDKVAERGHTFISAELNGKGRKSEHWVKQRLFCLDFDKDLSIEEFEKRCEKLRITPAFTYKTFSHSESQNKFRTGFICEMEVTDIRMRNFIMLLMMRLFPESDKHCKDAARLFYGGKGIINRNDNARINPVDLYNKWCSIERENNASNFSREKNRFLKNSGVAREIEQIGVFHSLPSECEENRDRSIIYSIEDTKNSSLSHVLFEGFVYAFHWGKPEKCKSSSSKPLRIYSEKSTSPSDRLKKLTPNDVSVLTERCRLFSEFHSGARRLPKLERRIILSNLRWYKNGLVIYKEGIAHFDSSSDYYDPYPSDDTDLIECAKRYNFKPESCSHCPYSNECEHGTNLLGQVRLRRNDCRKIANSSSEGVSIDTAHEENSNFLWNILNQSTKGISILQAECGTGKTEALLRLLPESDSICIAFPTHRLAIEAYNRYCALNSSIDYFLWPDRPRLPKALQEKLDWADKVGVSKSLEVFEEALTHSEVTANTEWLKAIEEYLEAYRTINSKSRIFCTHEKALRLMNGTGDRIQTFVFDEDPIKSLLRINTIHRSDIQSTINHLNINSERYSEIISRLSEVLNVSSNSVMTPTLPPLSSETIQSVTLPNTISTPVLSLLDCTGYIAPSIGTELSSENIYSINHRVLSDRFNFVIMSATPILPFYEKVYGERCSVLKVPNVQLCGRIYLHRERSYSKSSIKSQGEKVYEQLAEFIDEFKLEGLITFKDLCRKKKDGLRLRKGNDEIPVIATYGATEGFDVAGGTRLGVFGTPHLPEYALKLMSHAAGRDVNSVSWEFDCRTLRRGDFEVSLHCVSDDAFVQSLEVSLVERELVQAIGRARLVQNDTEVHLFSNYVVPGGELWERRN